MVLEGEYIFLVDFNRELSDLEVWRERLVALGLDCQAFSAEQTAIGTTIVKIRAPYGLAWMRALAKDDDMRAAVH